jgi:SAM-dependent methyltransferase
MTENLSCHCCGAGPVRPFYEVGSIPVHSCLLMDTAELARGYPRGDLRLGFCDRCGFIQNVLFDPGLHEYSTRYEESQGFSARFNEFARSLAQRLIDRYELTGKSALEIGCGKGEFLLGLCELGMARGVGIDPGYQTERHQSEVGARVRFIQDFYSEAYADLTGDLVCCRHTLEHIQPVREFLELVGRSLAGKPETVVFFEVPDTWRILEEGAFWDVYYEHCSYFTLGSLGRLFEACGFRVLDLELAYENQYLLIEAKPGIRDGGRGGAVPSAAGTGPTGTRPTGDAPGSAVPEGGRPPAPGGTGVHPPRDLDHLRSGVERFQSVAAAVISRWRDRLRAWRDQDRRVVLWGSGSKAVAFLTTLGIGAEVDFVVDINPYRQGKYMPGTGHEIVSPERLRADRPDVVVVMNPVYLDEIDASLAEMGLDPELHALGTG